VTIAANRADTQVGPYNTWVEGYDSVMNGGIASLDVTVGAHLCVRPRQARGSYRLKGFVIRAAPRNLKLQVNC
jgi:hypothetical protein